jgi:hypothetical protein
MSRPKSVDAIKALHSTFDKAGVYDQSNLSEEESIHMRSGKDVADEVTEQPWYHGTDQSSVQGIADGQKADHRGIQKFGPGFYVTPDKEQAEEYASAHPRPAVVTGYAMSRNPLETTAKGLQIMGRQFREQFPLPQNSEAQVPDAHLGNIEARRRGHDFLHVVENEAGDPIDVGVVIRPNKFLSMEESDV